MARDLTRTTLALPTELLTQVDSLVREGRVRSRNSFVAAALQRELAAVEATAIDAAFAGMAEDADYQADAQTLTDEFAAADWEAWRAAEDKA